MPHQLTLPNGSRLALRHPQESDIPRLYEAADVSRKELAPWMLWCHEKFCIDDAVKWVRETSVAENLHAFIIVDDESGLCLGTCGLHSIDTKDRTAELGYWVRTGHQGQGIAPAATRKVAEVAYNELKLVRVGIIIAVENAKSQRVAEKVGATREGIMRNGLMLPEGPSDAVLYSLIPSDFGD